MHIISVGGCGECVCVCACECARTNHCLLCDAGWRLVSRLFPKRKAFALVATEQSSDLLHLWFSATAATVSGPI